MKINRESVLCFTAVVFAAAILAAGGTAFADESLSRAGFTAKLGIDLPGTLDIAPSGADESDDVRMGYSGAFEYVWGGKRAFNFGVGIKGQTPRRAEGQVMEGKIAFLAGYGMMNWILPLRTTGFNVYSTLHLGYSYPLADAAFKSRLGNDAHLSGDIRWAAGLGVLIGRRFLMEALYNADHGEVETGPHTSEFEYRQWTLSAGFRF